jgi:methionyl-tRNA formyltransferase
MVAGERIFFQDAEITPTHVEHSPGKILALQRAGGTIAVGGGALRLRQVRRENGSMLSLPGLCEEFGLGVGDFLPCS